MLVNIHQVLIIHGKGTGQMKKGIEEYLKTNMNIKDFTEAPLNEGGSGATIVSL